MSQNPAEQVLQVATGYMASAALFVTVDLGIADHLKDGPRSAAELAGLTGADAGALHRILRLLTSLGIFEAVAPETYGLNPASTLLCRDAPGSMRAMARFLPDPLHLRVYAELKHSAMTGEPAVETALGQPVFEYLAQNPEYSEIFNDAMTALSAPVVGAALEVYDFSAYSTIVDVAGGHGEVLMSILNACPDSRGILAEVDHVVAGARPRIAAAGLADRCEAVECDFFDSVPSGGDAYVMKHIIHDWDDQRSLTILRNIAAAMGDSKGKVILLESVIPEGPEPDFGKFIDIEMLAMPGGRERTATEFGELFEQAGFRLENIVATKSPLSVVEAVRV